MSALLYVPPGASPDAKAPAILAVHGYINSRETQDGFAIELSRRGFVVLAMDQTGHGYSDPPAFANSFGGSDGLAYLRSLDFVDRDNIGLEGHSMGGWAVLIAAASSPDDYRAVVIEGSSTGTSGAPDATAEYPRNLAVVFSKYDEFSALMWGTSVPGDVPAGEKLMAAFGTTDPVEPGRLYGSLADGTARVFHQPPVTHPADHFSRVAIGHAVDWFQTTLEGESTREPGDQIWYWKELGTLVALVGMIVLLFGVGATLLAQPVFQPIVGPPAPARGARGGAWWVAALLFAMLPAVTLFPFKDMGAALSPSAFFAQSITNQIMVWALLNGAISAALLAVWHLTSGRAAGATADDYGLTWDGRILWGRVGGSFVLALLITAAAYGSLSLSAAIFTTDYRFWVFAVKPMSLLHLRMALVYLIPFVVFFGVYGAVLSGQLRRDGSPTGTMLRAVTVSTLGFVALITWQYVPLFLGGTLAIPSEPLWSIIAFQFLPIMTIVAVVTAYFHERTGHIWVGAFLSGMLVAWIVVASQATHWTF
ncbi:MAG: alpha/beta fold hydrolase [Gemmatimonadetes bacterium]|nr:alpha/beta fold hydrolase [Gemmatimonadota bacterium]